MKPKTRLDSLVKLRESEEERARIDLARAAQAKAKAEAEHRLAVEKARHDGRQAGCAKQWELVDSSHLRSIAEKHAAGERATAAKAGEERARSSVENAHKQRDIATRAADRRRHELVVHANAKELKAADQVATLIYQYRKRT